MTAHEMRNNEPREAGQAWKVVVADVQQGSGRSMTSHSALSYASYATIVIRHARTTTFI